MSDVLASIATLVLLGSLLFAVVRMPRALMVRVWTLCLALVLAGGVSIMVAHAFVTKWGFRGDSQSDGLVHMMQGTAFRPFVYRRLAPELVEAVTDLAFPRLPARAVNYLVEESPLKAYRARWKGGESWEPRKALAFHVAYVFMYACFFASILVTSALIYSLRRGSYFNALTTSTLGMCFAPLMFVNGGYLYDASELLLWTALLLAAVRGWLLLLPVLFLALAVNKESALLVVPALFPLLMERAGVKRAAIWCSVLGALGLGWIAYVHHRFAAQPGGSVLVYVWSNLAFWRDPKSYFMFGTPFGPIIPAPRGGNLALLLLCVVPLRFGWSSTPVYLRRAVCVLAALLLPLFIVAGSTDEVRALLLLFPLLFLTCLYGVDAMFPKPEAATQT